MQVQSLVHRGGRQEQEAAYSCFFLPLKSVSISSNEDEKRIVLKPVFLNNYYCLNSTSGKFEEWFAMVTGSVCPRSTGGWHCSRKSGHGQKEADQSWSPRMTRSHFIRWENLINVPKQRSLTSDLHQMTDWKRGAEWKGWWESKPMTPACFLKSLYTISPSLSFVLVATNPVDKCCCSSMRTSNKEKFHLKNYCRMLFSLHFKDMRRHIKLISVLWGLWSRLYSIEFRLLNIYSLD